MYRIIRVNSPSPQSSYYHIAKEKYNGNLRKMHQHCLKLKHKKADNNYIELVGFDGTVKNTYNIFSVGKIIGDVKEMPMGDIKCNLSLFADYHPKTSVKGYGFKDAEAAKKTLKLLKGKDLKYQKSVVSTMLGRAKTHPHQTDKMRDAIKIFEYWLKGQKGGTSYPYLSRAIINKYMPLAEEYGISRVARGLEKPKTTDKGFLQVYRRNSDASKLADIPVRKDKPDGANWEKTRINRIKAKMGQMKRMKIPYFREDGKPTKMHCILIMWAYSPYASKL